DTVDLGGFRCLVHNHNLQRKVILSFELDLTTIDLPLEEYSRPPGFDPVQMSIKPLERLSADVQSARVEVTIGWNRLLGFPQVVRYAVAINGRYLGAIELASGRRSAQLTVNAAHPLFVALFGSDDETGTVFFLTALSARAPELLGQVDALPNWDQCLDP